MSETSPHPCPFPLGRGKRNPLPSSERRDLYEILCELCVSAVNSFCVPAKAGRTPIFILPILRTRRYYRWHVPDVLLLGTPSNSSVATGGRFVVDGLWREYASYNVAGHASDAHGGAGWRTGEPHGSRNRHTATGRHGTAIKRQCPHCFERRPGADDCRAR